MIKFSKNELGIIFIALGFVQLFYNSFLNLGIGSYGVAICLLISLALIKKITPLLFCIVGLLACILFVISPSPVIIAALFPIIGFLFSGENRHLIDIKSKSRYYLWCVIASFYFVFALGQDSTDTVASHNLLSALVALAMIVEIFYFGNITLLYAPLIIFSFLFFGNRSSIFLLAIYIKNKWLLMAFGVTAILFILITNEIIEPPIILNFLFEDGGILFRSFKETRGDYFAEFVDKIDIANMEYSNWGFTDIPKTIDGFYDLHNSFLTVIVRDSYLGILKVVLWFIQFLVMPLNFFLAITLRAYHDSFLLGGVIDVIVFGLIGKNMLQILKSIKIMAKVWLTKNRI